LKVGKLKLAGNANAPLLGRAFIRIFDVQGPCGLSVLPETGSDLTKTGLSSRKKAQLHFPFCPTGKAT
jgi:hypothetical protein